MDRKNRFRGCLIGGAAGDALGYAVEFHSEASIFMHYGPKGIRRYDGRALISDDTQMTLFTANGLLCGAAQAYHAGSGAPCTSDIAEAYRDWYRTQTRDAVKEGEQVRSWLLHVPELWNCRAPGNTCLSAIEHGMDGSPEHPINHSKGCGGVMRVAPIGLYLPGVGASLETTERMAAEAAALTHGHPLGWIPAAILAHILALVTYQEGTTLRMIVEEALADARTRYGGIAEMATMTGLLEKAMALSQEEISDLKAIHQLGEGWVAEETLAIAVYCALKYEQDFDAAIIAAVNHKGDSDSTGAVTGNILGAYLGMEGIPEKYLQDLELRDVILEVADDLYHFTQYADRSDFDFTRWQEKYLIQG